MRFRVSYSCTSNIGKCRKVNQDNYICLTRFADLDDKSEYPFTGSFSVGSEAVLGVFDGLGGEMCGERAAYIAAKEASAITSGGSPSAVLYEYCLRANDLICRYADENRIPSMGTTAALLMFGERDITLCSIGDSKVFRFSDGVLRQISHDHLIAAAFGGKPQLFQNLGIPDSEMIIEPYLAYGEYHDGDVYLICTDGLTDMVDGEELRKTLTGLPFDEVPFRLLEKALDNGGRDNITFILCRIEREVTGLNKLLARHGGGADG